MGSSDRMRDLLSRVLTRWPLVSAFAQRKHGARLGACVLLRPLGVGISLRETASVARVVEYTYTFEETLTPSRRASLPSLTRRAYTRPVIRHTTCAVWSASSAYVPKDRLHSARR